MRSIPLGATGSFRLLVMQEHLASRFKDSTLPPVLATPVMIMVMENAALNAIKPYLESGESALGTRVDVRHLAATPAGRSKGHRRRWAAHRVFGAGDRWGR
jgi:fluoroacetyl-CoA thioesterase